MEDGCWEDKPGPSPCSGPSRPSGLPAAPIMSLILACLDGRFTPYRTKGSLWGLSRLPVPAIPSTAAPVGVRCCFPAHGPGPGLGANADFPHAQQPSLWNPQSWAQPALSLPLPDPAPHFQKLLSQTEMRPQLPRPPPPRLPPVLEFRGDLLACQFSHRPFPGPWDSEQPQGHWFMCPVLRGRRD